MKDIKNKNFKLVSNFSPSGDQPKAIEILTNGLQAGLKAQTLLGVTGSGKTFTMANVIANMGVPTLILAHNKTLAAQLYSEFKDFFPENAVEYFVSYYDYFQPEAYVPKRDLYIEKDADVNESIERYRNLATQSLLTRNDVIIVSSVSCIYGLGSPQDYMDLARELEVGDDFGREKLLIYLNDMQYKRSEFEFSFGMYRVRGDTVDINIAKDEHAVRISFFGDEIESIMYIHPLTGEIISKVKKCMIFPNKHFVTPFDKLKLAAKHIRQDLEKEYKNFKDQKRELEAERLLQRTNYDLEMLSETGYVSGIENYSRYIDNRPKGTPPSTLIDYFPKNWLLIVDESHMTIPQVRGMYKGDRSRKETLVNYGFRLEAALDNRPLRFNEFNDKISQALYVSATPSEYEKLLSEKEVNKLKKKKPEIFIAGQQ